ncbi:hypothetical protein COCNU_scaffold007880G000080 [Cocos nucifera]|nr:hypothetical protein [Cocos nucifera]
MASGPPSRDNQPPFDPNAQVETMMLMKTLSKDMSTLTDGQLVTNMKDPPSAEIWCFLKMRERSRRQPSSRLGYKHLPMGLFFWAYEMGFNYCITKVKEFFSNIDLAFLTLMDMDIKELCHEVWNAPPETYVHIVRISLDVPIAMGVTSKDQGGAEEPRTKAPKVPERLPKYPESSRGHGKSSRQSKGCRRP